MTFSLDVQIQNLLIAQSANMAAYLQLDPNSDAARGAMATIKSTQSQLTALQTAYATGPEFIYDSNIAKGIAVTSTSTPALNGTYPCDDYTVSDVAAELDSIMLNGTFVDGASTVQWANALGAAQTFSIAQFRALGTFMGKYVGMNKAAVLAVYNGQTPNWPSSNAVTLP